MNNAVENVYLYNQPFSGAYQELCKRAFPSMESGAESNDFTHFVSVESLSDDEYNVFLIECEADAKIIYGMNPDLASIREVVLKRGEFQSVVRDTLKRSGVT